MPRQPRRRPVDLPADAGDRRAAVLLRSPPDAARARRARADHDPRQRDRRATSMGVNLAAYKTRAFALSAAYAGVGGALYVFTVGFVVARVVHARRCRSRSSRRSSSAGWRRSRARCSARCSSCSCRSTPPTSTRRWPGVIYGAVLIVFMYVERGGIVGAGRRIAPSGSQATEGGSMQRRSSLATLSSRWWWPRRSFAAGCGRERQRRRAPARPGVTDTTIKLGGSYPFSGPASAYATISRPARPTSR